MDDIIQLVSFIGANTSRKLTGNGLELESAWTLTPPFACRATSHQYTIDGATDHDAGSARTIRSTPGWTGVCPELVSARK